MYALKLPFLKTFSGEDRKTSSWGYQFQKLGLLFPFSLPLGGLPLTDITLASEAESYQNALLCGWASVPFLSRCARPMASELKKGGGGIMLSILKTALDIPKVRQVRKGLRSVVYTKPFF